MTETTLSVQALATLVTEILERGGLSTLHADALGRVIRPEPQVGQGGHDLVKIEPIGGYALQLFWGDGHSSGIYSFDYLRRLAAIQSES